MGSGGICHPDSTDYQPIMSAHLSDHHTPVATDNQSKIVFSSSVKDADDTLHTLADGQAELGTPLTPEEDRRIRRKVDLMCVFPPWK